MVYLTVLVLLKLKYAYEMITSIHRGKQKLRHVQMYIIILSKQHVKYKSFHPKVRNYYS